MGNRGRHRLVNGLDTVQSNLYEGTVMNKSKLVCPTNDLDGIKRNTCGTPDICVEVV